MLQLARLCDGRYSNTIGGNLFQMPYMLATHDQWNCDRHYTVSKVKFSWSPFHGRLAPRSMNPLAMTFWPRKELDAVRIRILIRAPTCRPTDSDNFGNCSEFSSFSVVSIIHVFLHSSRFITNTIIYIPLYCKGNQNSFAIYPIGGSIIQVHGTLPRLRRVLAGGTARCCHLADTRRETRVQPLILKFRRLFYRSRWFYRNDASLTWGLLNPQINNSYLRYETIQRPLILKGGEGKEYRWTKTANGPQDSLPKSFTLTFYLLIYWHDVEYHYVR